jgi:D-alanyl-D-alanine carboxypeptidase (penicillin-binding protein 5/6)
MVLFFRTPAAGRLAQLPFLFVALVLLLAVQPLAARAQPGFAESKFAAIVMDADTGKILYAKNADDRRYPASLTKVMTLYLTFDALERGKLKMSDRVVFSRHAAAQAPTKLGLRPGQSITVKQAIDIVAVKSANDVATALAEKVGGSESRFARMMTAKAHELGATHTRFYNASGLPDSRHVTTAHDLALIARATIRDFPQYYDAFGQERTTFRGRVIPGHDHLLAMDGVDGVKTGYTRASGFNLISSGMRGHHRIVAVVLGGSTARTRDRFMAHLLRAGFAAVAAPPQVQQATLERLIGEPSDEIESAAIELASNDASPVDQGDADDEDAAPTWSVQVGAFSTQDRAALRLKDLRRVLPGTFGDAEARTVSANGLFNARFGGFSPDEARAACAAVKARGEGCFEIGG